MIDNIKVGDLVRSGCLVGRVFDVYEEAFYVSTPTLTYRFERRESELLS